MVAAGGCRLARLRWGRRSGARAAGTGAPGAGAGLVDRLVEALVDLRRSDVADADALLAGAFAGDELEACGGHAEDVGEEGEHGGVRPAVGGWGRHTHPQRVAVAADDGGASGTGLDAQPEQHIGRCVWLRPGARRAHHLEQVVGHVAIL